jgi:hypothetical protein
MIQTHNYTRQKNVVTPAMANHSGWKFRILPPAAFQAFRENALIALSD